MEAARVKYEGGEQNARDLCDAAGIAEAEVSPIEEAGAICAFDEQADSMPIPGPIPGGIGRGHPTGEEQDLRQLGQRCRSLTLEHAFARVDGRSEERSVGNAVISKFKSRVSS